MRLTNITITFSVQDTGACQPLVNDVTRKFSELMNVYKTEFASIRVESRECHSER